MPFFFFFFACLLGLFSHSEGRVNLFLFEVLVLFFPIVDWGIFIHVRTHRSGLLLQLFLKDNEGEEVYFRQCYFDFLSTSPSSIAPFCQMPGKTISTSALAVTSKHEDLAIKHNRSIDQVEELHELAISDMLPAVLQEMGLEGDTDIETRARTFLDDRGAFYT